MPISGAEPAPKSTRQAGWYCVVLMALYHFASVGLISVPVSFILKNDLHLSATGNSIFSFFSDGPYFIGFAFGFLRDRWRPWGKGDRAYFAIVPIVLALTYVALAYGPHTYGAFLARMVVTSACGALLGACAQGTLAAVGKDFGMTGRLSVVTLIAARAAQIYTNSVGGWLGEHSAATVPFLASAAVSLSLLILAVWRPRSVFRIGDEVFVNAIPEGAMDAMRRLMRHRAIYLPAAILFLWEFAPGWGTPLLYFMTNTVKLSESEYGSARAWQMAGTCLAALSYTLLCQKFRLKPLLYFGTFVGVLGGPIFLLIHTPAQAYIVELIAGMSCGLALASYFNLLMRCCPMELEGVAAMLSYSAFTFAADGSDIFGSWLYDKGGFGLALTATTIATAAIFIPVYFVPHAIIDPEEGQRIIDEDPPVAEPLAS